MPKIIKRILISTVGVIFVIAGILGLALPFLQGFFFLMIGLILLSLYAPVARERVKIYAKPYPKLHASIEKTERWIIKITGEL